MADLVIAAVQMTSGEDVDANLERCRELVREAATAGALIVGLPENFAYLGTSQDHKLALAERLPPVGAAEQQPDARLEGEGAHRAQDGADFVVLVDPDRRQPLGNRQLVVVPVS